MITDKKYYSIRQILRTKKNNVVLFRNNNVDTFICKNIVFCNTLETPIKVSFFIKNPSDSTESNLGAILLELEFEPHETVSPPERVLVENDYLIAYTETNGSVSFCADFEKIA